MTAGRKPLRVVSKRRKAPRRTAAEDIALALLLWRYVGHRVRANGGLVPCDTIDRAERALALAKIASVRDEYLAAMMASPILSLTLKNLGE